MDWKYADMASTGLLNFNVSKLKLAYTIFSALYDILARLRYQEFIIRVDYWSKKCVFLVRELKHSLHDVLAVSSSLPWLSYNKYTIALEIEWPIRG